jgi:hypothetical protein
VRCSARATTSPPRSPYNARDPKGQLQAFRTSPSLRIAVTVDMIATGTDVKPLECVFFMRDVRSAQYFEQMKGRGARTIDSADFQSITPDATEKTRFVIVDAIGVTEHDFVDPPLNREKGISLKKLLEKAAALTLTEDETATLASRLAKLELQLTPDERGELDNVAGAPVRGIVRGLVDAVDPDIQAKAVAGAGKQGDRGVYITTSAFTKGAREEAERINARIELIDVPAWLSCSSSTESVFRPCRRSTSTGSMKTSSTACEDTFGRCCYQRCRTASA